MYPVAILAIVSLFFSLWFGLTAKAVETTSEDFRVLWAAHYQKSLENQENEEMRELAENYHDLYNKSSTQSFRVNVMEKSFQAASQSFILSLMLILVEFSVAKKERKELRAIIYSALFVIMIIAITTFVYPFVLIAT